MRFLGGVGTVTGSKCLVTAGTSRVLVDCGLFQGYKQLRLRNWAGLPFDAQGLGAVVLTHAHLDHSGYIPLLVKSGFDGPIYCTRGTRDLCSILLPDSGFLQERDADFANRHGFSKHRPALPLYTMADAERSLNQFVPMEFHAGFEAAPGISAEFKIAGHILGAAMADLRIGAQSILFSGDLGRPNSRTMLDPETVARADYLVLESTYGNRTHDPRDPEAMLAEIIRRTVARGGTLLVPCFAVGRAQTMLYHLARIKADRRAPPVPIYLDSPMAIDATNVFQSHAGEHKLSAAECHRIFSVARYVSDAAESKALDANPMPKIILAASGMATGGRVLHHLKLLGPDIRNTILFTGYQAGGTRGAAIIAGAPSVKIHGAYVPIRAEVAMLDNLSAHADADEIFAWLGHFEAPPRRVFINHGEPAASDALRHRIEEQLDWACTLPEQGETIALT
ncbi:MAG: MBL fold metallo-hydrolase RNA specificity domain-containing protein [Alphaproteobacteria bacterium]